MSTIKKDTTTQPKQDDKILVSKVQLDSLLERLNTLEKSTPGIVTEHVEEHTARVRKVDGKLVLQILETFLQFNDRGEDILMAKLQLKNGEELEEKVVDYLKFMNKSIGEDIQIKIIEQLTKENVVKGELINPTSLTDKDAPILKSGLKVREEIKYPTFNILVEFPDGSQEHVSEKALNY